MSTPLSKILPTILSRVTGTEVGPLRLRALGGGSINSAYQLVTTDERRWFCKMYDADSMPDLFTREGQGLELLGRAGLIRVPAVIACEIADGMQVLVLEWIEQGLKTGAFWTSFGEELARLHMLSQPAFGLDHHSGFDLRHRTDSGLDHQPCFGLDHDNYMGSLPQSNTPEPDWTSFFIRQRLEPQLQLAINSHLLPPSTIRHFQGLYRALPEIFPPEPPSLLHGDLWSGNFLCDANSRPVLIDPAVYYGHRSIDLAMTTLFGGFEPGFYEAYDHHYPFPPNYREQWEICNLYPLLIHLNLFGESYSVNILRTIQRF